MLGTAYVAGMMLPLVPLALIYGRAKRTVRDPKVTLRLGARTKQIGIVRLAGVAVFGGFGVLFITLALTGKSDTAPGFQRTVGLWMRELSSHIDGIPNAVALPALIALLAVFGHAVVAGRRETP